MFAYNHYQSVADASVCSDKTDRASHFKVFKLDLAPQWSLILVIGSDVTTCSLVSKPNVCGVKNCSILKSPLCHIIGYSDFMEMEITHS